MNENCCILIKIKIFLKSNPMGKLDNKSALVQIMVSCRLGNKPLSEPELAYFYWRISASMRLMHTIWGVCVPSVVIMRTIQFVTNTHWHSYWRFWRWLLSPQWLVNGKTSESDIAISMKKQWCMCRNGFPPLGDSRTMMGMMMMMLKTDTKRVGTNHIWFGIRVP